jgi:hypothetical protein
MSGCHRTGFVTTSHQPFFNLSGSATLRLICPYPGGGSAKKVFFAKRTQSCSMFTDKTEKTTARETHQNQYKTVQNRYETYSNDVETTRKTPQNGTFYRLMNRHGDHARPVCP